jgi:hypothetical protein
MNRVNKRRLRYRFNNAAVFVLSLLLASCVNYPSYTNNPQSPLYALAPGSALVLNRDLTIPGEKLAVYLQGGEVFAGAVNHYAPSCKFELRYKQPEPQIVHADEFTITRFTYHQGDFAQQAAKPLFQPVRYRPRLFLFDEDGPTFIVFASYFFLHSATQPDVLRLTCSYWENGGPLEGRFLSLAEIQAALGEVFTLHLEAVAVQ